MMPPTIRQVRPADLDALYGISLATGLAGGDASHLYGDPKLMGHIYAAPYAVLEPQFVLVIEDGEGVAGFAAGTTDTTAWEQRLEQDWWPALRERYALPAEVEAQRWTADQRRAFMIHRPTPTPRAVALKYPAHLHINLLPRLQGRGVGATLFERWTTVARARRKGHPCRDQPRQYRRRRVLEEDGVRRPRSRRLAGRTNPLEGPSVAGQRLTSRTPTNRFASGSRIRYRRWNAWRPSTAAS